MVGANVSESSGGPWRPNDRRRVDDGIHARTSHICRALEKLLLDGAQHGLGHHDASHYIDDDLYADSKKMLWL